MNPGPHGWIEEFQPSTPNMEDNRVTQEQVLESKTGSYTPEIKKVSVKVPKPLICKLIIYML